MSYKITKGDLEITNNVLREVVRRLSNRLSAELLHFDCDKDCPSYEDYNTLIDALVYIDTSREALTNH